MQDVKNVLRVAKTGPMLTSKKAIKCKKTAIVCPFKRLGRPLETCATISHQVRSEEGEAALKFPYCHTPLQFWKQNFVLFT